MPHDCLQIHMDVGTLPPVSWGLLKVTEKFPKETGRQMTDQGLCLFGHLPDVIMGCWHKRVLEKVSCAGVIQNFQFCCLID